MTTDIDNRLYRTAGANRRVDACLNACKGIPTEALEARVVEEMVAGLELLLEGVDVNARHGRDLRSTHPVWDYVRALLAKVRP